MSDKKNIVPKTDEEAKQAAIDHLIKTMDKDGVAVSTVSDGVVLAFKREHMLRLLELHKDSAHMVIFIKKRSFED